MSTFRPLYDRVLAKRVDASDRSAGGLFIPEAAKEKPQEAEVIAVGPGRPLKDGKVSGMTKVWNAPWALRELGWG